MYRLHIPGMIYSLKGNHTTVFRNPKEVLRECKPTLPSDILEWLRSVLYNKNPTKFYDHTTAAEKAECSNNGNNTTITKNNPFVDEVMNKEDQNK